MHHMTTVASQGLVYMFVFMGVLGTVASLLSAAIWRVTGLKSRRD